MVERGNILKAWRRESTTLRLIGQDTLPVLTASFDHVTELALTESQLDEDPSLFLSRFPELTVLDLRSNRFEAIPQQVGLLEKLVKLDLGGNQLVVSDTLFDVLKPLGERSRLEHLLLRETFAERSDSLAPRVFEPLSKLPRLRTLDLASNDLSFSAQGLQGLCAMPTLQTLLLQENNIELNNEVRGVFQSLVNLRRLNLNDNPLGVSPDVTGLRLLRELGLGRTHISEFPQGCSS